MTNTNGVLTCTNIENYEIFCNGGTENQISGGFKSLVQSSEILTWHLWYTLYF